MALQSTTALATITLQQNSSTVTFSGIPNTYRDLIVVCDFTTDAIGDIYMRFNGATSGYTNVQASGSGSAVAAGTYNTDVIRLMFYAQTSTSRGSMIADIMDYAQTNKHKTVIGRVNNPLQGVDVGAGRWASTDAVNTVSILGNGPRIFLSGSTFSLYGRIA